MLDMSRLTSRGIAGLGQRPAGNAKGAKHPVPTTMRARSLTQRLRHAPDRSRRDQAPTRADNTAIADQVAAPPADAA